MIQILAIRKFYSEKQKKEIKSEVWFELGYRAPTVEDIFAEPDRFVEQIPIEERKNVYYTIADCAEERGRKLLSQHHIPFDVDGIEVPDADTDAHLNTLAQLVCQAIGVPHEKIGIIFSGNGLQFIIGTTTPIESDDYFDQYRTHYGAICDRIDLKLSQAGVEGASDRSVWSPARLMRMPKTWNEKPNKPRRMSRILNHEIERLDFDVISASGLPQLAPGDAVPDSIVKEFPTPDVKTILEDCKFLQWGMTHPAKVSEPEWYAALSITSRFPEGRKFSHKFSEGHPGYSFEETEQKIDQSLTATTGPRTCKNIDAISGGKCAGCKHRNTKLVSPLLIEGPEHIKTASTGFYNVTMGENGRPKRGKPDFDGLCRFYNKQNYYKATKSGSVWTWNGTHYVRAERSDLGVFAHEHFDPKPLEKQREEFVKTLLVQKNHVVGEDWFSTTSKGKMNFQNGVLEILTNEFLPHSKEIGFRATLPYDYDKNAECPKFLDFLGQVTLGRQELIKILQEFMGYTLANAGCGFQRALLLLGEGSNGKSTFVSVIRALAGEAASAVPVSRLDDSQQLYMLEGKMVNIVEENADYAFRQYEQLKNFISGGEMNIKRVYEVPYKTRNTAQFILLCNRMPASRDRSHGFFRRFLIVPFDATFEVEQGNLDRGMDKKLLSELPGILNWAMEGYKRLLEQSDFTTSDYVKREMDRYIREQDPYVGFLEDALEFTANDNAQVALGDIFTQYQEWCKSNGYNEREAGTQPELGKVIRLSAKKILAKEPRDVRLAGHGRPRGLTNVILRNKPPV